MAKCEVHISIVTDLMMLIFFDIRVCHLAGVVINQLKENQPELGINDHQVKCVEIAGLCQDIGK